MLPPEVDEPPTVACRNQDTSVRFCPAVPPKKSLTKDDWLRAAMELLRTRGVGGVRVLTLAQELRVSRGSFYWHFDDRQYLLDSMLDWWEREMTDTVIQLEKTGRAGPQRRLLTVAEEILTANRTRYDPAVRSWAEGDKKAAKVLRRVLRKRLDFVSGLFEEIGFTPAEARARGDLLAVYLMSEWAIHMDESFDSRLRLVRRQVRLLSS
jgi:AcrR family transcriptional regulator